jgi:alpha-glucosidase
MSVLRNAFSGFIVLFVAATGLAQNGNSEPVTAASPDGQIVFQLSEGTAQTRGSAAPSPVLQYTVEFHGQPLMNSANLGIKLAGQPDLGPGMHLVASKPESQNETYSIPAGKTSTVRNHYNGVRADYQDASGRKLTIEVRAFDDGVAFRYVVPEQSSFAQVRVVNELTEFNFAKDAITYPLILDGYQTSYEDEYQVRNVNGLHRDWIIGAPYLANVPGAGWVAITEADIDNYAGMYLRKIGGQASFKMRADLSPHVDASGKTDTAYAVETSAPFSSPWRVLMIGDEPGKLIESNIILNLNPPSKIADTSWIKPGKSAWDWWSGEAAPSVTFKTGMNTATMKHYIDFASASGFAYMLIDAGWAKAPERKNASDYSALADITQVDPSIDMPELVRYAKEKNVKLWLWSHWSSVDKYMDKAFPLFEKWGIAGVKIDFMDRDDQWMVNWYRKVADLAAQNHLMIDFHGAFKPDGLRRIYPNVITREGVMGKEYLKWSARTSPQHNATLPFTRMLAGPMDYTPGAFGNAGLKTFVPRQFMPMGLGTRAQELALYVVFESPLEMVSDYPEHYAGQKEFDFIKRVPTTWDEVHSIGGEPTKWISLARRSGSDWYIGTLTNWNERTIRAPLSFLGPGKYVAEIYADAPDAATEATHTTVTRQPVDRDTVLDIRMVSGGGNAIWIHPAQ